MKKLLLSNSERAFELLGEYAGVFGDNGGDPDGNAWLPSNQDNIPGEIAESVVKAGYGRMVEVQMATDEAMYRLFGFVREDPDQKMDEETFDLLKQVANERLSWAHYGAYGAGDSHWVFAKES